MLTRINNFFTQTGNQVKIMFANKEARKEITMDALCIAPYVVTDALLYYASYLNFLASQASDPNHPENESWYFAAYCTGTVIMSVILAPALFLAFSDTACRMLNIQDNEYRKLKAPARRVIGLPGSLTKVVTGDSSLYTYLVSSQIPKNAALGIACTAGILALPALASFLWSDHNKSINKPANKGSQKNLIMAKQVLAYLTSACYAMDVGFVYFHSALNIPKNMGLLDHDLSKYQNTGEHAAYAIICVGTVIESIAVFLAFARLNANMFGLVHKETNIEKGCWVVIEDSWVKKGVGSFAVIFKVFNTAVSAYNFFKTKMPIGGNITFIAYSSIQGLLAQSSLLVNDPLNNQETTNENDQASEIEQGDNLKNNVSPENRVKANASKLSIFKKSSSSVDEVRKSESNDSSVTHAKNPETQNNQDNSTEKSTNAENATDNENKIVIKLPK